MTEKERKRVLKLMIERGSIKEGCKECKDFFESEDPRDVFAPRHTAMPSCKSGKRDHCTCDTCF